MNSIYVIEVLRFDEWVRMKGRHPSKKNAREWLSFVKKAWHGMPTRIVRVELTDGPPMPLPHTQESE